MSGRSLYNEHCIYLPAFLGWFFFSALLSSYNKLVFGNDQLDFPCPLLLTSIHFLVQWCFAYVASSFLCGATLLGGDDVRDMPWRTYLSASVPCGIVTALDVGLSNLSLVRISLAFYTMVKASSPVFVLASAYAFNIERITPSLLLVVLLISVGEFLTVLGEVEFDALGFALCVSASALSGMRWTVVQLKLHTLTPPLKSTVATMRLLAPSMFLSMFTLALVIERPWKVLPGKHYFDTTESALQTIGLGLGGAVLAVSMIVCEFYLIMKSSAIVLMIGGVIKEMVTILVGVSAFGDQLDPENIAGCAVVFCGVIGYKISHHLNKLEQKQRGLSNNSGADTNNATNDSLQYQPVDEFDTPIDDDEKQHSSYTYTDDDDHDEKKMDYTQQNKTNKSVLSNKDNHDDDEFLNSIHYDLEQSFELTNHEHHHDDHDDDAIQRLKLDLEDDLHTRLQI